MILITITMRMVVMVVMVMMTMMTMMAILHIPEVAIPHLESGTPAVRSAHEVKLPLLVVVPV